MKNYKYKIDHDYGLAPNPFGGYCTLAVCKSQIRNSRYLEIGSWIFGTGAKSVGAEYYKKLIFCMQVEEKITFNEYWNDSRFQYKKPILNGSLAQMYGDNIYYQDNNKNWVQIDSAHSNDDGTINFIHLDRDVSGKYVLISKENFFYWGDNAIEVPGEFYDAICTDARDREIALPNSVVDDFVIWLNNNYKRGFLYGDPISWKELIGE